ncbi:MAG: YndJ family transporter [Actinomycetota bacterium]
MGSARRPTAGPPVDAIVGTVVWVVVFALSTGPLSDRIGLLEGLWLIGPLVVAPLGFALLRPPPEPAQGLALARLLTLPAGVLVVLSVLAEPGGASAWLTLPWVVVTSIALWAGLRWLALEPSLRAKVIVPVSGLAFLLVGAAGLVAWRAQLRPMGLSDTRVALAAVHMMFAGFGAAVIADRTRAGATRRRSRSVAGVAGVVTVAAIPVLAAGLVSDSAFLDLVGSLLVSAALLVVAVVMLIGAMHRSRAAGSTALLVVSGASVLFALALAVQFALGQWSNDYTLSITRMLELHGTVSGLGFVVGGLFGWTLADVPDDTDG